MATDFVGINYGMLATIRGRHASGKVMFNTIHARAPNLHPSVTDVANLATDVAAWCLSDYRGVISNQITLVDVTARSIAEEPGPVGIVAVNTAGSLAGDQLSCDTTLCSSLLTGFSGLSRRGKFFVFTADESTMTSGLFTAGYASSILVALTNLIAAIATSGNTWVIASYRHLALYDIGDNRPQIVPSHLHSRKVNVGI